MYKFTSSPSTKRGRVVVMVVKGVVGGAVVVCGGVVVVITVVVEVLTAVISFTAGKISSGFSETDLKIINPTAAKSSIDEEIRVILSWSFNIYTFILLFITILSHLNIKIKSFLINTVNTFFYLSNNSKNLLFTAIVKRNVKWKIKRKRARYISL
jgi:hypothetical protein